MATTPTHAQALFTVPFSHNTDFTELANHCERFAHTQLETDDPAEKLALCARLSACLALLQPTLNEPIPPHLVEHFTLTLSLKGEGIDPVGRANAVPPGAVKAECESAGWRLRLTRPTNY